MIELDMHGLDTVYYYIFTCSSTQWHVHIACTVYVHAIQGRFQDIYGGFLFAKIWTPTGDFQVSAFSISTSSIVHE